MKHLWGVLGPSIPRAWELVRHLIEEACDRSEIYNPEDIKADLESGYSSLWIEWGGEIDDPVIYSCMVTRLERNASKVWLRGILAVGEQTPEWNEHLEEIEAWAKSRGASHAHMVCRYGFEKNLKPMGYRKTHILMEKRL